MRVKASFSIHFGPFSLGIASPSPSIIEHLKQFFTGYEASGHPDFTLIISPTNKLPPPMLSSKQEWIPLTVNGSSFEIGPQLIQGVLSFKQKLVEISVHEEFFNHPILNIFQSFLYRLYHTLCLNQGINSYFIHGCGVLRGNFGYLFVGPHQSGKTTIGELSDCPVLHDDQILVTIDERGVTMDSPPLPARIRHHPDKPVPLQRIFAIFQNIQVSIKLLTPSQTLKHLYNEVVLPLTLDSTDLNEAKKRKSQFCFDLLKSVPIFALHFDRNGKFWQKIEGEQVV
jgi:hypothetical protein